MKFFFETLKKLLFVSDKKVINLVPFIGLFFISASIDIIGLSLMAPFVGLIVEPEFLNKYSLINFFSSFLGPYDFDRYLIFFSLSLILIFVMKALIAIASRMLILRFAYKQFANLQVKLMSAYQGMNYIEYLSRQNTSYIRNVRDLSKHCIDSLDAILKMISDIVIFLMIIFYLAFVEFKALILLISIIFFISFFFNFYLKPKSIKYGKEVANAYKIIYKGIDEAIKGFKEIRIISKENFFLNEIKLGANKVYEHELKNSIISISPRYILEIGIIIFIISFTIHSLVFSNNENNLIATIGVFALAGVRLLPSISAIVHNITQLNFGTFALETVYEDLIRYKNNTEDQNSTKPSKFQEINFSTVSFKYPNSNEYVLKDVSLTIKSNECIGILGPSGSGKTTVIDILLGLLKPESGKIILNGQNINKNLKDLSRLSAYLTQDCLILESSIKNNICLESQESKINYQKIKDSIQNANLTSFINNLPNKIDTLIGEGGIRLSGGQKQRLAIARTFYHEKEVLVMDEATSSLDFENENIIMNNISEFKGKKTIIVVTHKPETIKNFDKIYQLKDKKIEEIHL